MKEVKEMLKYQQVDGELIKLERELETNENKRQANFMIQLKKDATEKTIGLNKDAAYLLQELDKIEETEKKGVSHIVSLSKQDIANLSEQELKDLEIKVSNATRNVKELERRLSSQVEKTKSVLREFENTTKKIYLARQRHQEYKEKYDALVKELEPKIEEHRTKLKSLEKVLDKALFEKYKELRKDKVFPMIVALKEKACGGCRTNLPSSTLERLKQNGTIQCENCRRIIYIDEE